MTNLLEKALLTGFSLFVIIVFISIITPFLGEVSNYYNNSSEDIENYIKIIEEIDNGINFIIKKPELIYSKEINLPKNLNISFFGNLITYDYIYENKLFSIEKLYNQSFIECVYRNNITQSYLLKISYNLGMLNVSIE